MMLLSSVCAQAAAAEAVHPELPCGHVGVGLSDEDACEPKHGNAAVPVLSPGSSSSGRGNSRGSGSRLAHELRTVITSG